MSISQIAESTYRSLCQHTTYYERKRRQMDLNILLDHTERDAMLKEEIKSVLEEFLSLRKLERYGSNLTEKTLERLG
jgi:hypothetical protein